jgi:CTP:molybdopterin cytidylyltransferase MocA
VHVWTQLGAAQIAVVINDADPIIKKELHKLQFHNAEAIANPGAAEGMFSSILSAAHWNGWQENKLTHWVIALGDQPHFPVRTLRALLSFAVKNRDRICQPALDHRPRHPVILPRALWTRLRGSSATSTLRDFLEEHRAEICLMKSDDPALALDIDTPAQYARALALLPPRRIRKNAPRRDC